MGIETTSGNPHDGQMDAVGGSDGTNAYILKVDSNGAISISSILPGTAATSLGKAEDAAHTTGDVGVMALGVANASHASRAADGDYIPIATNVKGDILISGAAAGVYADAQTAPPINIGDLSGNVGSLAVAERMYNGSNSDQKRNNIYVTAFSSAARTATSSSSDLTNYNHRGVKIFINVTAITDTPSVVFTVEEKDSAVSNAYNTILTSAAIVGTGLTVLTVYPGATTAANVAVSTPLPRVWRITATHADTDSITYSVGVAYIL